MYLVSSEGALSTFIRSYQAMHMSITETTHQLWEFGTNYSGRFVGLPAHKTRFWIFRFKIRCLQIFSLKQQVSMVTNVKIMMSSVLQILKSLVFKSSVLIFPQIWLIFSLQENTRGAPFVSPDTGAILVNGNHCCHATSCQSINDKWQAQYSHLQEIVDFDW